MRSPESFLLTQFSEGYGQTGIIESPEFLWGVIVIFLVLMFRKIIVCFVMTKAVYVPDDVLKRNKPFYINKTMWNNIQAKALMHKEAQDEFSSYINLIAPYYFSDKKIDY
jgi:hypothetical protein